MAEVNKVTSLRLQLKDALGDNADKYFDNMKQWFRMKMTKEDFDYDARKLLTPQSSHLHNRFVFALLQRCQILADSVAPAQSHSTPVMMSLSQPVSRPREHKSRSEEDRRSRKKPRGRDRGAFEAVDMVDYVTPMSESPPPPGLQAPSPQALIPVHYDAFLPDAGLLLGRFLLAGWDHGLESTEDSAAHLLAISLQHFLKSVLTAVFTQRSGFRLRDNKFVYAVGNPVPNPWLKNTSQLQRVLQKCQVEAGEEKRSRPTPEQAEQRAAYEIACATSQRGRLYSNKQPVSLFDLYDALKMQRCVIKSHLVYAMTMERIIARLNHPSHEEVAAANVAL